jgi:metal-responsive CopG/Arc/MetJ family transcriptional regulator
MSDKDMPSEKPNKSYKVISQKVRIDVLKQVDDAVAERAGMNRSAWIQEAIQEKLKRKPHV